MISIEAIIILLCIEWSIIIMAISLLGTAYLGPNYVYKKPFDKE